MGHFKDIQKQKVILNDLVKTILKKLLLKNKIKVDLLLETQMASTSKGKIKHQVTQQTIKQ